MLVKTLIGKGCAVRIFEPNVSVSAMVGAKRRYIEREIRHITSLMCDNIATVIAHAGVVVTGSPRARNSACDIMTRVIFVVSRNHLEAAARLKRDNLARKAEVIVDRRRSERRQRSELANFPDRRQSDRRIRSRSRDIDLIGIAVVVMP